MKKVAAIILGLVLTGCTRNIPVDNSVVTIAKSGCSGFNSEMQDVFVRHWFVTSRTEAVFTCKIQDAPKTIVVTVSFKDVD